MSEKKGHLKRMSLFSVKTRYYFFTLFFAEEPDDEDRLIFAREVLLEGVERFFEEEMRAREEDLDEAARLGDDLDEEIRLELLRKRLEDDRLDWIRGVLLLLDEE